MRHVWGVGVGGHGGGRRLRDGPPLVAVAQLPHRAAHRRIRAQFDLASDKDATHHFAQYAEGIHHFKVVGTDNFQFSREFQ